MSDVWAGFDDYKKQKTQDIWAGFDDFTKGKTKEPVKKEPIKLEAPDRERGPESYIISGQTKVQGKPIDTTPVATKVKQTVKSEIEAGKQVLRDVKKTGEDIFASVKNRIDTGFSPLAAATAEYLTKPEKTSTARDIVTGIDIAKRSAKEFAGTALDIGSSLIKGTVRTIENANRGRESVSGNATLAAAKYINETFNTVGADLVKSYKEFDQVSPDAKKFATSILSSGMQVAGAATTDLGELALAAAQEVPGLDIPARALMSTIGFAQEKMTQASSEVLKLAGFNEETALRAGGALAGIATAGIAVKGLQKGGQFTSRVMDKTVNMVNEMKAKATDKKLTQAITDTSIESTVRRAAAEVMAEDGAPALKNSLDAAYLPRNEGGVKQMRSLDKVESVFFESEMKNNTIKDMGEMLTRAQRDGFELDVQNLRVDKSGSDVPEIKLDVEGLDRFPARYDIRTNTITFNFKKVAEHLTRMFRDGEAIIYGSGAYQRVMRVKSGESFDAFRKRYLEEMYEHEAAHARTITADDIARLDDAALKGDKATMDKIIVDLENRANDYTFKKQDPVLSLDERASVDEMARLQSTVQNFKETKGAQPFGDSQLDSMYENWKRIVKRNPDALNEGSEAITARLIRNKRDYPSAKEVNRALFEKATYGTAYEGRLTAPDDFLDLYRKRYEAETKARKEYDAARETLKGQKQMTLDSARREKIFDTSKKDMRQARILARRWLIEEGVPSEVRGKLLTEFSSLRKPEDVKAFIDEANKEWDKVKRRNVQDQIKKEVKSTVAKSVNGARRGKLTPEVQKDLDTIRNGLFLDRGKAWDKIIEIIDDWETKNQGVPLPDDLVKQIEILKTQGIKEQGIVELEKTLDTIRSLKETGKTVREAQLERRKQALEKLKGRILEELPEARKGVIGQTKKTSSLRSGLRWYNSNIKNLEFLADFISAKSKYTSYESYFSKFAGRVRSSYNNERSLIRADEKKVSKIYQDVFGLKEKSRALNKKIKEIQTKKIDLGKVTDGLGKEIDMVFTKDQLMYIEALTRNKYMLDRLKNENNGWTDEMLKKVKESLDEKDFEIVDRYVELFKEKYPDYSSAHEADTGLYLGKHENYVPVSTKQVGYGKAEMSAAESVMTPRDVYMKSARPGSARMRSKFAEGTISFDRGLSEHYFQYIDAANHYITHWELIRDVNRMFADGEIQRRITDNYGKEYWDAIKAQFDESVSGVVARNIVIPGLQKLNRNISSALIQSTNVIAGQFSSNLQFLAEAPSTLNFIKHNGEALLKPKKAYAELEQYSKVFAERYADQTVLRAMSGLSDIELSSVLSGARTIQDMLGVPITVADKITTTLGGYGYYKTVEAKLLKKGYSPERAKMEAGKKLDTIISRTQSEAGRVGKSLIEKRFGPIGPLLNAFSNQPQKILQVQLGAIRGFKNGRISAKQMAKILFITGPVMSAFYETSRYGAQSLTSALGISGEPQDDLLKKIGMGTIMQPLGGLPIIRDIVNMIVRSAQGKQSTYKPGIVSSTFDDIGSAFFEASQGDWEESAIETLQFATKVMGIGFAQAPLSKWKSAASEKATERKKQERSTPEAKMEASRERFQKKLSEAKKKSR